MQMRFKELFTHSTTHSISLLFKHSATHSLWLTCVSLSERLYVMLWVKITENAVCASVSKPTGWHTYNGAGKNEPSKFTKVVSKSCL